MTPTNDQIVAEASRRAIERGWGAPPVEHFIIEVVREGWTPPPPPVDPDLLAVREIVALEWQQFGSRTVANETRSGDHDDKWFVNCALAAYKAGREAEALRAKALVEPAQAIVNRAVRGTGANDLRWPHIVKAARRLEQGLNAYNRTRQGA